MFSDFSNCYQVLTEQTAAEYWFYVFPQIHKSEKNSFISVFKIISSLSPLRNSNRRLSKILKIFLNQCLKNFWLEQLNNVTPFDPACRLHFNNTCRLKLIQQQVQMTENN